MTALYELLVLGSPSQAQLADIEDIIERSVGMFNLHLRKEIGWIVCPNSYTPKTQVSTAAIFFGGDNHDVTILANLMSRGVPILPVVSENTKIETEIPAILRPLNCLVYTVGPQRIASALLECVGLLPKQRRVFVSYRREEAREAALQLFDTLSSRLFDVFLDTHGIPPAEDFQAMLWHRLCDSDVLLMLDTPGYFDSRWTSAEFGRALAKGISVLRVGWPDCTPSSRTATASRAELLPEEIDKTSGRVTTAALERICLQLEEVRSQSHAVRSVNLVSNLRNAIQTIGGKVTGVGINKTVYLQLPDGKQLIVYPVIGVPTSTTLHDASIVSPDQLAAVVYDHIGLNPKWLNHLDWLGQHIHSARWVKASEASWIFADWEE
ncbi:TIR domain-containing protein [Escherichia coli]|uniref:toll/interleukin-1 receptor domain-containing protein n=1 Tax=Escherichia coli TaxID=562 RepID=UPI000DE81E19|nr:toll/interleukin-1 receptor domain-containing protein [Escherichia coli]RCA72595.1 TIR domain-containing protein [Escherichia coli]RCE31286.1 TIR domain-containing protein [Escherichia coli]